MEKGMKTVERRTLLYYFSDGLWDILLGLFLLCWGAALLSSAWVGAAFVFAAYGLWLLRRRVTCPRRGYVRFGIREDSVWPRLMVAGIITAVVLFTAVMVLLGMGSPPAMTGYFALIIGGVVAFNVCIIAGWLALRRFFVHAAFICLGVALCRWLGVEWGWGFAAAGGVITAWGLALLGAFLRRYPRAAVEEVNSYGG